MTNDMKKRGYDCECMKKREKSGDATESLHIENVRWWCFLRFVDKIKTVRQLLRRYFMQNDKGSTKRK